jgi:hypothetical protein
MQAVGRTTFSLKTAKDGTCAFWFDATGGPVTLIASKDGTSRRPEGEHQGRRDDDGQLRAQGSLLTGRRPG